MATELNKVNFVDQDFATAVTQVRNFLDTNFPDEFNDYVASNLGLALIEIIAYAEQNMLWYLNRKVNDLYFPTAVTPRSISKIARMLGYKSIPATAAKTTLDITLSAAPYVFPVQISLGFQFQGPNNQIWEYRGTVPVTVSPGDVSVSGVEVTQGETVTSNFVSDGTNNQFLELLAVPDGKFVEGESVVVAVNGEEWTEQPVIPFSTENNYETNLLTFPPIVRFGDSVQGNVPPLGAGIEVTFAITDGFRGRIVSNSITDPVIGLIAQFEDIPMDIAQVSGSVGGDDPEDIRSITVNAPLFQRTQNRAITKGDYDFLSNQYVNVARADAQIIRSISGDFTVSALLDSILARVIVVSDGVTQEISGYEDSLVSSVDAINEAVIDYSVSSKAIIEPFITSISGKTDNICVLVNTTIDTMMADITPFYDAAASDLGDVDDESLALIEQIETVIDIKNVSINVLLDDIETAAAGLATEATIDALVATIRAKLVELKSEASSTATVTNTAINVATGSTQTNIDSIISEVVALSGEIETAVAADKACIASDLGQICLGVSAAASGFEDATTGYVAQINSDLENINNVFLVQTSGLVESVCGDITALSGHLDENLSDSCRANEVQVKVLSKDAARKYVNPLTSTKDGLAAELEGKKDITHTISVVDGLSDVIDAVVKIQVKVDENAVEEDVVAGIFDALAKNDVAPLGILVEREFNKPLYIWEIDGAVRETVENAETSINFLNITIEGPAQYLDSDGNLISPTGTVIQVGSVTVEALPRFVSSTGSGVS